MEFKGSANQVVSCLVEFGSSYDCTDNSNLTQQAFTHFRKIQKPLEVRNRQENLRVGQVRGEKEINEVFTHKKVTPHSTRNHKLIF